MIKVAIVGTSKEKWKSKEQIDKAKEEISKIFFKYLKGYQFVEHRYDGFLGYKTKYDFSTIILVSGHCPKGGVDIWAEEVADEFDIKKEIYEAEVNQWEDKVGNAYKGRQGKHTIGFAIKTLTGFKSRNIQIAEACDVLYCIAPHIEPRSMVINYDYYCPHCKSIGLRPFGHPKNGGCWTMNYAKKLGKETHLVVID